MSDEKNPTDIEVIQLAEERKSATGNVARIVTMFESIQNDSECSIYVRKLTTGEYAFCTRLHNGTGVHYGDDVLLTKEEALESKRLQLTPFAIED